MIISATRRDMLKGAGALAIGFDIMAGGALAADAPGQKLPGDLAASPKVSSWLRVEADGKIRLLVGKVELGQGVLTAVAQLCAEELDVDIKRIVITSGDTRLVPDEGVTAGSFSMPNCGSAVRQVAAEARQILLGLAAKKLGVDAGALSVADGAVKTADGKSVSYFELIAGEEFNVEATGKAPLKAREGRRYVGKSYPRLDIPFKVAGSQIFVQDIRPEGMLHGRVLRPPAYDSKLVSLDTSAVEKTSGIVKVVRNGSFVGVIAEREEQALDAIAELRAQAKWDVPASGETHDTVHDWMLKQAAQDIYIRKQPVVQIADKPRKLIGALYKRPYHMHASIGPSTAVATLDADGVTHIQTHSQSVFETAGAIAEMLGVEKAKVHCQHMQGSGCYGHNGADDAAADAALLAQAVPGRPVRIQWTRNDEHKWEPFGSAMVVSTAATVDEKGDIVDWMLELWSTSHGTRPGGKAGNLLPARYLEKPFALPKPVNGGPPNYAADRNAIARYKGLAAYCAVAMEVAVDTGTGKVRVIRVCAANDAGEVVTPDGVKNQIEGGIVQSLSWSLKEAVRFGPAGVRSVDWTSYPILTFSEVPPIQVELIDQPGTPFLGTGEASQGPTGAALANAIFDATGARLRDIPFTPARVKAALQA